MKVLVADDHSLFCDGLISLLEATGFEVVGQARNGRIAVEETVRLRPDLVLMDINMPQMNGLEALRRIKAELPETQVVMLTVSDADSDLLEAVRSGAQGYIKKDLSAQEFLEMLRGLQQGEAAIDRKTVSRLLESFSALTHQPSDSVNELTPREIELLQLIAEGLSNKAVAEKLYISENTVKYHLKKILQKLGVQNRTEAVAYALSAGLISSKRKA